MTNIAYLSGIVPGNEPREFSRTIAPAAAIDPLQLTKGEMQIALLAEQLRIVGTYYDNQAQIQEAKRLLDILAKGLHTAPDAGSTIPAVNTAIRRARRKLNAATRITTRRSPGQTLTDAALSGIAGQAHIGEVLIPFQDCDQFIEYPSTNPYDPYAGPDMSSPIYKDGYQDCVKVQEYVRLLNDKLTPVSHHLLYEYATASESGAVQTKRVLHRNALSNIAKIATLDIENMRGWLRNALIKNNLLNGTDPFQPEDTIYILKTGSQGGVGAVPITAVLAAIAKVIGAIVAAVTATVALVNSLRSPDKLLLQNSVNGIGTPTFGPEQTDFLQQQTGATGDFFTDNKGLLIPAGAALAVLLIAK